MCDTFVATGDSTATGNVIFGKNSDREPNEAQALVRVPGAVHDLSRTPELQTTYIRIPQISESSEVLLSKPFQMWGAEMGANAYGLAIGNEALFTRIPFAQLDDGLTGMDLVRLALERCRTAEQALELITDLIARYSQDACGGYTDRSFYYHNSFILADPDGAFVLETAGRQWAAVRVRGYRAISNGITIEGEYDFASPRLIDFAREKGWLKTGRDFNFRECYSAGFMTYFSRSRYRQARSTQLGRLCKQNLDVAGAISILRDHGVQAGETSASSIQRFAGNRASMKALCVHASGITTPSQTTGSMVAELRRPSTSTSRDTTSTIWLTGSAAPCLSTFKPCFVTGHAKANLTAGTFAQPGAHADDSLWWRHERIHRAALLNYAGVAEMGLAKRDDLERDFFAGEKELMIHKLSNSENETRADRAPGGIIDSGRLDRFSRECFARADAGLNEWSGELAARQSGANPIRTGFAPLYHGYRRRLDRAAGLESVFL